MIFKRYDNNFQIYRDMSQISFLKNKTPGDDQEK